MSLRLQGQCKVVPIDPTKQTPAPFIEANQRLTCIVYVRLKLVMPIGVYAASGSLGTQYKRVVGGIGGFDRYVQPRRANQSYNTVMLNFIVIQHQSFDVPVIYSHSLRVPLMAGPMCLAFFSSDAGLYVMPMFDKLGLRL